MQRVEQLPKDAQDAHGQGEEGRYRNGMTDDREAGMALRRLGGIPMGYHSAMWVLPNDQDVRVSAGPNTSLRDGAQVVSYFTERPGLATSTVGRAGLDGRDIRSVPEAWNGGVGMLPNERENKENMHRIQACAMASQVGFKFSGGLASSAPTPSATRSAPFQSIFFVLASAPDFVTLHAAVRVCSTWHRVFETQPTSVLLAVARNVAGSVLAQAMCVVRYPYPEQTPNDWGDGDGEGANTKAKKAAGMPDKSVASYERASIDQLTPQERMQLQENAATVRALEDIFSLRYKNRTSKIKHAFPARIAPFRARSDGTIAAILDARYAHLNAFPTDELLHLRAVVAFLHELIGEALDDDDDGDAERASSLLFRPLGLKDICLATGPTVILAAHRARTTDAFEAALEPEMLGSGEDNALYGALFAGPLTRIWEERGVVVHEEGVDADGILDGQEGVGVGREEKCAQCGLVVSGDARLWTESTWPTLISIDFCALLPGLLPQNEVEAAALVPSLMDPNRGAAVVLRGIFDDDLLTPAYKVRKNPMCRLAEHNFNKGKWGKRDALCGGCLDKLVGAHLHLWMWLYERKVEDGWKPPQNCWYGYNCKTQVHKIAHARDKNHLCVPIRYLGLGDRRLTGGLFNEEYSNGDRRARISMVEVTFGGHCIIHIAHVVTVRLL
ncbi:hypothetical protein C8R47DRAFT_1329776 [Mycena vitilis]|nr:hypothetical protein C8R47DRAFT_1329776 [Mycena vitilis]